MRWRFPHSSESGARTATLGAIESWWLAFAATAPRVGDFFRRHEAWDLAGWMRENLGVVDERITWEFGPGTRAHEGHRLVLTPEAEHHLRPLVDEILGRAPALAGWEFHAHRLPDTLSNALRTVAERTSVDLTGWCARAELSDDGLVDVSFAPPAARPSCEETVKAALVLLEALVGEDVMNLWIGSVEIVEHGGVTASLSGLASRVHALVRARRALIPTQPYWRRVADAPWTLLRLAPKTCGAEDYPGQQDLLVAKTVDFDLWRSQHGRRPFHSCRFSRSGEVMATLKIDGADELPADGFANKTAIEDAVEKTLVPRGLGAHVGGGTGLRYSYIDLALTDVAAAMDMLRPVLRAGKLPRRTWLQFFDAELAEEWIPLWDDAPPPPR